MAKFTISVTASIETSSLIEARSDAERVAELLTGEFFSVAYNVEIRENGLNDPLYEQSAGHQAVVYH